MIQVMLFLVAVASAADRTDAPPVVMPPECDSCTSRHNALKRLRDQRMVPLVEDRRPEAETPAGPMQE